MPVNDVWNTQAFVWKGVIELIGVRHRLADAVLLARRKKAQVALNESVAMALLEVCDQALTTEKGHWL